MLSALRKNILTPPYHRLPLAVFLFFSVCFLLHPLSPVRIGQLTDPDDYMRLNEVINWLTGQDWYDLSQPRLSPGAHTIIHWSRLVDLPIALVMLPLIKLYGMQQAALIASCIVPPLLFALLLVLLPRLVQPLTGNDNSNLAVALLLFAPMVVFNFAPGRVDHHGYQILIAGFGLFCLDRILHESRGWLYAIFAASAFACGLWIGTEALPWLLLFITCLALIAAWQGGLALRNAAIFGTALTAATAIILPLALPLSEFSSRALSWFSAADVIFAVLTAFVFIIGYLLGRQTQNRFLRCGLFLALGFCAAAVFVRLVPDTLIGPFADYDSFNSTIALENINEARPLSHAFWIDRHNHLTAIRAFNTFVHVIMLPLLALIAIGWNIVHTRRREQTMWTLHGVFLLSATLLTLFWQVRVGYFMQLFSIAPLVWLLGTVWQRTRCVWKRTAVFLLLGPLPVVFFPILLEPTHFYRDIVLFPAARTENNCPLEPAALFLDEHYSGKDITILSGMNEGPELMFRTPYKVIAGNFNVSGNEDVRNFFNARDDQTARAIADKWHTDVVLSCRSIAPFMAGMDHPTFGHTVFLHAGTDGKLHLTSSPTNPALIEKLVNNKAPDWLKPVEIPGNSSYLLFEIIKGKQDQ